MKVSLIQMNSREDKAANLVAARKLIEAAVNADQSDLVVLPEMFTCLADDDEARRAAAEPLPNGEAWTLMRDLARRYRINIHAGSILESAGGAIYNTSCAFDRAGNELGKYRKIHLFDVVTPDGKGYLESNTFSPGTEITTYLAEGHRFGASICYDLRFPELYQALQKKGVEAIVVPAAFTEQTGRDHWEVLLRARAIETQSYILAAGQCGSYANGAKRNYGNSLICDPWGRVIAKAGNTPCFISANLDFEYLRDVRSKIPLRNHKRLGCDGVIDDKR